MKITIAGGFHNAPPIHLILKNNRLSLRQYRRINNHMCGVTGCTCGWRGYSVSGINSDFFHEIVVNAQIQKLDSIFSGKKL